MPKAKTLSTSLVLFAVALALAAPVWAADAKPSTVSMKIGANRSVSATLYLPGGQGPFPAVLLLQGENGWEDGDQTMTWRLVDAGYAVLVPEYLSEYGILPQRRKGAFNSFRDLLFNDLSDGLNRLRQNGKIGKRVGALGFATGGYFALWLAAAGKVDSAVSYYGDLGAADTDSQFECFSKAFTDASAPVLVLQAGSDEQVPNALATQFDALLTAKKSPHTLKVYKGAEHGFDRSTGYDNWTASKDAWNSVLDLFGKTLKP